MQKVQRCPGVCRLGVFRDGQDFTCVCMVHSNKQGHAEVGVL